LALLIESGAIYILIGVSFALAYKHGLSRSLFSLQIASLVTITICIHFGLTGIAEVFTPVGIQLAVRNTFQGITLMPLIS
jgi:hypothetical protein